MSSGLPNTNPSILQRHMQRQLGERFEPGILKIDVKFAFRGKKVKKVRI